MQISHRAANSGCSRRLCRVAITGRVSCRCVITVEGFDKADKDVVPRRPKFGEKARFVGLHPGIDGFSTLDGMGLLPAFPGGWNELHTVLAGGQVLDTGYPISAGEDHPITHYGNGAIRVIGGAKRVAKGVLKHLAARSTVLTGRIEY